MLIRPPSKSSLGDVNTTFWNGWENAKGLASLGGHLLDGANSSGLAYIHLYLHPCHWTVVHGGERRPRGRGKRADGVSIKQEASNSHEDILNNHSSSHLSPAKSIFQPANMMTKALPFALLAGAASAACPLSVEITDSESHVVNVAVTNTGSETISVFKGNTVFSDHATKDLLVADAGVS